MRDGSMDVFATGRYLDRVVEQGGRLMFKERLAVCDSNRFDTLVAFAALSAAQGHACVRRIAIAIGDPNGIGPEIAVRAAAAPPPGVAPILVGDEYILRGYAERFAPGAELQIAPLQALERSAFKPGALDPRAGAATVAYMREAVRLCLAGGADAVVGCPHSETAVNRAGIAFNGYTGLVADLTGTPREKSFMMLVAAGPAHRARHAARKRGAGAGQAEPATGGRSRTGERRPAAPPGHRRAADRRVRHQPARRRGRPVRRRR
jgi:hypothetical protein